jgi:hypothetical protein
MENFTLFNLDLIAVHRANEIHGQSFFRCCCYIYTYDFVIFFLIFMIFIHIYKLNQNHKNKYDQK